VALRPVTTRRRRRPGTRNARRPTISRTNSAVHNTVSAAHNGARSTTTSPSKTAARVSTATTNSANTTGIADSSTASHQASRLPRRNPLISSTPTTRTAAVTQPEPSRPSVLPSGPWLGASQVITWTSIPMIRPVTASSRHSRRLGRVRMRSAWGPASRADSGRARATARKCSTSTSWPMYSRHTTA